MTQPSMSKLKSAFAKWRRTKRHRSERVPANLLELARQAAAVHGTGLVARELKIEKRHLKVTSVGRLDNGRSSKVRVPGYSRIEVAPANIVHGLFEIETPAGAKIRIFQITGETTALISPLCGIGGGI